MVFIYSVTTARVAQNKGLLRGVLKVCSGITVGRIISTAAE